MHDDDDIDEYDHCSKHSKYVGKRYPIVNCKKCRDIWYQTQIANPTKLIRKMTTQQCSLGELQTSLKVIRSLKDQGYKICSQQYDKEREVFYITQALELDSYFISGISDCQQTVKWVELSDLHCGAIQFDDKGLREVLQRAVDEGYENVHISGDLHDGMGVYRGQLGNLRYWTEVDQAAFLIEILSDYKLKYISITGNHDQSFVTQGAINPIAIVQKNVPNFTFLNSFAADLVICGVLKRMVHLGSGSSYAKSYPGQIYVRNLLDAQGEHVYVQKKKYRIRFLQLGHFHTDIQYDTAGIKITHPGNFCFPNDYLVRRGLVGPQGARFTEVTIKSGKVLKYNSAFVMPERGGKPW